MSATDLREIQRLARRGSHEEAHSLCRDFVEKFLAGPFKFPADSICPPSSTAWDHICMEPGAKRRRGIHAPQTHHRKWFHCAKVICKMRVGGG